jgi:lytic murein transglycosylase
MILRAALISTLAVLLGLPAGAGAQDAGPVPASASAPASAPAPAPAPAASASLPATSSTFSPLSNCLAQLRQELPSRVSAQTFERFTAEAQDLRPAVEAATRSQPEFQQTLSDYVSRRVNEQRMAPGREIMKNESAALQAIEQRQGVDGPTTVAVFGVETDYGRVRGSYPVVDATLGRACLNLQAADRKEHFFTALWLLQEGVVQPEDFKGSWAGAFGLTQFMPATFVRTMASADGSPRADIIHSVPDALATTARYLRQLGWVPGVPWAVEVKVPLDLARQWNAPEGEHGCLGNNAPSGKCRRVAQWAADGVERADGRPLVRTEGPADSLDLLTNAALLMPAGAPGPAWLVTANYQAVWRYNRADAYALAIGLLSDAFRGSAPQRVPWPTDDAGLSRAEFMELQSLLHTLGHCDMAIDGVPGPKTGAAIRDEERKLGLVPTGRGGQKVLAALRKVTPSAACGVAPAASTSTSTSAAPAPGATAD